MILDNSLQELVHIKETSLNTPEMSQVKIGCEFWKQTIIMLI